MASEIERKFLGQVDFKPFVTEKKRIIQEYLSSVPECTIRVRLKDNK